jgi:tetratricopeptide (TPR) repeat protein
MLPLAVILGVVALVMGGRYVWVEFVEPRVHPAGATFYEPVLLLAEVKGRSLFLSPTARDAAVRLRPELLTADDRDPASMRSRSFQQAMLHERLFDALADRYSFDEVVLSGDASQLQNMADHLLAERRYELVYLDHWGVIFSKAGAGRTRWHPAQLDALRARMGSLRRRDEAAFLAQTARKLLMVKEYAQAGAWLLEAVKTDAKSADSWAALGSYHMASGQFASGIDAANRALECSANFVPALAVKAQCLFSMKRFIDAYGVSRDLLKRVGDDPSLLFYHAKIAHEAGALEEEIATLKRLIDLAEKAGRPAASYRLYLGQAYAKTGAGPEAIAALRASLTEGALSKSEEEFARKSLEQVIYAMKNLGNQAPRP